MAAQRKTKESSSSWIMSQWQQRHVASSLLSSSSSQTYSNKPSSSSSSSCRTLWFAGFHQGPNSYCKQDGGGVGYRHEYATALQSARLYARDVLQPVLLLGRYGMNDTADETGAHKLRTWAAQQGAIVIAVDRLSFQADIVDWMGGGGNFDHLQGPYLRLDLPQIMRQHQDVCTPRHLSRRPSFVYR